MGVGSGGGCVRSSGRGLVQFQVVRWEGGSCVGWQRGKRWVEGSKGEWVRGMVLQFEKVQVKKSSRPFARFEKIFA